MQIGQPLTLTLSKSGKLKSPLYCKAQQPYYIRGTLFGLVTLQGNLEPKKGQKGISPVKQAQTFSHLRGCTKPLV